MIISRKHIFIPYNLLVKTYFYILISSIAYNKIEIAKIIT